MDKEKAFRGLLGEVGRHLILSVGDRSFRGFFAGFKPLEYLIIDVPKSSEISDLLNGSCVLIGMFCTSGKVVQFKSSITHFIKGAAWLVIVSYPEWLEKRHDLRKVYRVECSFPCKLVIVSDLKEYHGIMADVSTGGCKFTFPLTLPSQAKMFDLKKVVLLEFALPGSRGKKGLFGEVLHADRHGSEIVLGIKFASDNDVETMEELSVYILEMMRSAPS